MEIFVSKDGQTLGPFGEEEVIAKVDSGELSGRDLAMTEGMDNWLPLNVLIVREPETPSFRAAVDCWTQAAEDIGRGVCAVFSQQPTVAGLLALLAGCVLMLASRWPVLIYGPFFIVACIVSFMLIRRQRLVVGIFLLALVAIAPAMLWRGFLVAPEEVVHGKPAASTTPTPVAVAVEMPTAISTGVAASPMPMGIVIKKTPEVPKIAQATPSPSPHASAGPVDSVIAVAQQAYLNARNTFFQQALPLPTPPSRAVPPASPVQARMPQSSPMPTSNMAFQHRPSSTFNGSAQSVGTAAPPQAFTDISSEVYLVDVDEGKGSGFIAEMGGATYFVTNFHVAEDAKALVCSNPIDHFTIDSGEIQVATDRDLVRFPIRKPGGLRLKGIPDIGEAAFAYGNSGGRDVVTRLDGKILGVGPTEVEVSAEFIPGNSGGPIANTNGDVLGVATYVAREEGIPDWVKKGTRFDDTRRFGVRVTNDIRWTSMPLSVFQEQSNRIHETDELLDDLVSMSNELIYAPFQKPLQTKFMNIEAVSNFVSNYNETCKDYQANRGLYVDSDDLKRTNRKFRGRIRQLASDLSSAINEMQHDLTFKSQDILAPYLKLRMTATLKSLDELAEYMDKDARDASEEGVFTFGD